MKQAAALTVSFAALLCACAGPPLPVPQYPLDVPTVEAALEEAGFSWTVLEGNTHWVEQSMFQLNNEEGKFLCAMGSTGTDDLRFLTLEFLWEDRVTAALPEEDWENAVLLATRLFGGFRGEGRVWESLRDTHEEKTEVLVVPESNIGRNMPEKEVFLWQNQVDGIQCMVKFERWTDWGAEEPHTVLQSIWFTSPPDALESPPDLTPKSGSSREEGGSDPP